MEIRKNQPVGNTVCIDWDLFYADFIRKVAPSTVALIKELEDLMQVPISAFYRESSNGNVHLKLVFPFDVSVLDAFMVRAWMADDRTRLRLDLARYLRTGSLHEMNRCFGGKVKRTNGQTTLQKAGEWVQLFQEDHYLPDLTTQDAHTLLVQMEKEHEKRMGKES
jgi:hypothetical protein